MRGPRSGVQTGMQPMHGVISISRSMRDTDGTSGVKSGGVTSVVMGGIGMLVAMQPTPGQAGQQMPMTTTQLDLQMERRSWTPWSLSSQLVPMQPLQMAGNRRAGLDQVCVACLVCA